jgi:hypothetical protein
LPVRIHSRNPATGLHAVLGTIQSLHDRSSGYRGHVLSAYIVIEAAATVIEGYLE